MILWHKIKVHIDNSHNVFSAIAKNILMQPKTGFVVQCQIFAMMIPNMFKPD